MLTQQDYLLGNLQKKFLPILTGLQQIIHTIIIAKNSPEGYKTTI